MPRRQRIIKNQETKNPKNNQETRRQNKNQETPPSLKLRWASKIKLQISKSTNIKIPTPAKGYWVG